MLSKDQIAQAKALKLSENFTLFELINSTGHPELVQYPTVEVIEYLRDFANLVLQPIRKKFGPIGINSGWRNDSLNKAVGGVKDSVHKILYKTVFIGVATDIVPKQAPLLEVYHWAFNNIPQIKTIILYRNASVTNTPFIHIDTRSGRAGRAKLEKTSKDTYINFKDLATGG